MILVDFGVARALGAEEDQGTIAVGTPRYMAPEVFAGGTVVGRQRHLQPRRDAVDAAGRHAAALRRRAQARQARARACRPSCRRRSPAGWRCCRSSGSLERVGVRRGGRRPADRRSRPLAGPVARPPDHAPARHGGDRAHRRRHVRGRGLLDRADRPQERRARLRGGLGRGRLRGRRHAAAAGRRASRARSSRPATASSCPSAARTRASPARSPRAPATCPYTMVVAPLIRDGKTIGVLSVLDRRDGGPYLREDLGKVALFADLAVVALDLDTFPLSSSGGRTLCLTRNEPGRSVLARRRPHRVRLRRDELGQPLRRDRRRVGLRRIGDGLPAGRGRQARARARARPPLSARVLHPQPVPGARELLGPAAGPGRACTTTGRSRASTRWSRAGLGGGSLIYANVFIRKDENWFVQEDLDDGGYEYWPVNRAELDPHYDRVEKMIGLQRYPVRPRAVRLDAEDDRLQGGGRAPSGSSDFQPQAGGHVRQRGPPAGAGRGDRGGAPEPPRPHAHDLPDVRRVRRRLQLRRQEHARLQLPHARPAPRRGDPHAGRRAPVRARATGGGYDVHYADLGERRRRRRRRSS